MEQTASKNERRVKYRSFIGDQMEYLGRLQLWSAFTTFVHSKLTEIMSGWRVIRKIDQTNDINDMNEFVKENPSPPGVIVLYS